ncbi:2',3'-cyclic-nucleotide 3'-phosphodiesterase-like isoform X3 [Pristis pectinata]|uniref:2',3'-cyclic-nucleotide 3'-phosphodiesterase-like isoform X3 n=1 Tax=Pristis pectinata TaxID=685728 RepID=UPI00223E5CAB|nr:2',3'-cyclic-nucleotide 3'-phosphodiesterase-like isoform X3 [Pristis pectinata]
MTSGLKVIKQGQVNKQLSKEGRKVHIVATCRKERVPYVWDARETERQERRGNCCVWDVETRPGEFNIVHPIRNLFKMGGKSSKPKVTQCNSFPFLEDRNTIETIKEAHSFFILRGLPGSGKSTIAKKITEKYSSISAIASADDLGIAPLVEESEADGSRYNKLDQQIQQYFEEDRKVIVVDDTHHDSNRLDYLFDLASGKDYIVFIVNPGTERSNNLPLLVKSSQWKLSLEKLQLLEPALKKSVIPFFFGWFLVKQDAEKLRNIAMEFLDQLSKNETFLKEFVKYVKWDSNEDFNLQEYFKKKPSVLHCTTMFCDYGKVPNSESYARAKVVEQSLSKAFVLKVSALFITPRTVGARVLLNEQQQQLWPEVKEHEDADSSGDKIELPHSSRSHITLACAPGVQAVQTGLDLLDILKAEKTKAASECQVTLEQGQLCCLGEGRWIVNLSNAIDVNTLFSGFYAKKTTIE